MNAEPVSRGRLWAGAVWLGVLWAGVAGFVVLYRWRAGLEPRVWSVLAEVGLYGLLCGALVFHRGWKARLEVLGRARAAVLGGMLVVAVVAQVGWVDRTWFPFNTFQMYGVREGRRVEVQQIWLYEAGEGRSEAGRLIWPEQVCRSLGRLRLSNHVYRLAVLAGRGSAAAEAQLEELLLHLGRASGGGAGFRVELVVWEADAPPESRSGWRERMRWSFVEGGR